ncbi:MAG TPA: hypothetical protein VGJ46_04295, partial [Candidatus Limnocylindrales bacterium]
SLSQHQPLAPASLETLIARCLAKDPRQRWSSCRELSAALGGIREEREPAVAARSVTAARPATRRAWIAAGVVAATVALAATALIPRLRAPARPSFRSLAVLPLANLSGGAEQEYFVDGMHEALITDLAQIGAIRVVSRTSVMQYKARPKPLPEIARELNVDAVIEGSVARSGDRVRITAQLIDAPADRHLWAKSYERDLRDVLALQNEVASAIAAEIRAKLTPDEQARLASARPVNPDAYEALLKGQHVRARNTEEAIRKSIEYFEKAIALDPQYATAYANLAGSYNVLAVFVSPGELRAPAKAAVRKALELDPAIPEAHRALATMLFRYERDWPGAEREYRRAIELSPNDAGAHAAFSVYLAMDARRFDEALEHTRRAAAIDPLTGDERLGWVQFMAGHYEEAVRHYGRAIELQATPWTRSRLAAAYSLTGRHAEAAAECDRMRGSAFDVRTFSVCAFVYGGAGRAADARRLIGELESQSRRAYVDSAYVAVAYAGVGDKQEALTWLEKADAEQSINVAWIRVVPWFVSLRSEPRFQALVRRMNFPS